MLVKRGEDLRLLKAVINMLASGQTLPPKNRDHPLTGNLAGRRECHIAPDWLLEYRYDHGALILELLRTGSHADLFE